MTTQLRKNQAGQATSNGGEFASKARPEAADPLDVGGAARTVFEFQYNDRDLTVDVYDEDGTDFAVYDGNEHVVDFSFLGDPEDHSSVEDAAANALDALSR